MKTYTFAINENKLLQISVKISDNTPQSLTKTDLKYEKELTNWKRPLFAIHLNHKEQLWNGKDDR